MTRPNNQELFRQQVETFASKPLSRDATVIINDFWDNWEDIRQNVVDGSAEILVDRLFLQGSYPNFGRYAIWKGFGLILMPFSIFLILIGIVAGYVWGWVGVWQTGLGALVVGYALLKVGDYIGWKDCKKFRDSLITKLLSAPSDGMVKLCVEYICGNIGLRTNVSVVAFWPALPSSALTGKVAFIGARDKAAASLLSRQYYSYGRYS